MSLYPSPDRFFVRRVQYWNAPDRFHVRDAAGEVADEVFVGEEPAYGRRNAKNDDWRRYRNAMLDTQQRRRLEPCS